MAITIDGALKVASKKIGLSLEEYLCRIESEKWCTKGKHWCSRSDYGIDKTRGDGLSSTCITCRRVTRPYISLKGRVSTFKGRTHTPEAKATMSAKKKGLKLRLGEKHTIQTRVKISAIVRVRALRGEQCRFYKDGLSSQRRGERFTAEYKRWRFDVYSRDNFTCQECSDARGGNLNAHHIKPFAEYPELRFDINNGITLCEDCHKKKH